MNIRFGFRCLLATVVTVGGMAVQAAMAGVLHPAGSCSAGSLVAVVAHADDDLFFVNPGITDRLDAGWCLTIAHLIGGASDPLTYDYVKLRESGDRSAYAHMAGTANAWTESTITLNGNSMHMMTLAQSSITLVEFRIKGGGVRGEAPVPLANLWDLGQSITTWGMQDYDLQPSTYTRATLVATLQALFGDAQPNEIFALNPDNVPFIEHPDHIYSARIARAAAQAYGVNLPISYHLTYQTGGMPKNLSGAAIDRKRNSVAAYFNVDSAGGSAYSDEESFNGNYVSRRYFTKRRTVDLPPILPTPDINLANEFSSQCLTTSAPGTSPFLMGCDGTSSQLWHWQPVPSVYAGNANNAQLISAATQLCVAEHQSGVLTQEACISDSNNPAQQAQQWTPWDFGIVKTPLGNCLGGEDGALLAQAQPNCGVSEPLLAGTLPFGTEFRWARSRFSYWTDLRQDGGLYGDLDGTGTTSAVYVYRRGDGPGFNVWGAALAPGGSANELYLNAISFNPDPTTQTCTDDVLCFDSSRFLLADFDGDGKADLMVISPRQGGTGFWLMSGGTQPGGGFAPPVLWYQSTQVFTPGLAQQYLAGDFNGDGKTDILIVQQLGDEGYDLYVLPGNGNSSGGSPSLWMRAPGLNAATHFFAAHSKGTSHIGVLAVENLPEGLGVNQLVNTGTAFARSGKRQVIGGFLPNYSKLVVADINNDGADDLLVLHIRSDGPNFNLWEMNGGALFGPPTFIGTLSGTSWADSMPALVRKADGSKQLVLYSRDNTNVGQTSYSFGPIHLFGCPLGADLTLGSVQDWGTQNNGAEFLQSLRLDRLN